MVKVIWTDAAIQDLLDSGDYISKDSVRYAEITVDNLFGAVDVLEEHPKIGSKVPDFNNIAIRQLIKGDYRIVYKIINEERVDIITVHNCARLISNTKQLKGKKK